MSVIPLEKPGTIKKQIKVPTVNGDRYPEELEDQKYQVIRIVSPEDAKEVEIGAKWGSTRIGIQMLGGFPTYRKADDYAKSLVKVEDWCDYFVVSMYEWIEIPPPCEVPEIMDENANLDVKRSEQPLLQEYMNALQKNKVKEAQLMELRMDMEKNGDDGGTDVMLPSQRRFTLEARKEQLEEILANPDDYPPMIVKSATDKLKEVTEELEKIASKNEPAESD